MTWKALKFPSVQHTNQSSNASVISTILFAGTCQAFLKWHTPLQHGIICTSSGPSLLGTCCVFLFAALLWQPFLSVSCLDFHRFPISRHLEPCSKVLLWKNSLVSVLSCPRGISWPPYHIFPHLCLFLILSRHVIFSTFLTFTSPSFISWCWLVSLSGLSVSSVPLLPACQSPLSSARSAPSAPVPSSRCPALFLCDSFLPTTRMGICAV